MRRSRAGVGFCRSLFRLGLFVLVVVGCVVGIGRCSLFPVFVVSGPILLFLLVYFSMELGFEELVPLP